MAARSRVIAYEALLRQPDGSVVSARFTSYAGRCECGDVLPNGYRVVQIVAEGDEDPTLVCEHVAQAA